MSDEELRLVHLVDDDEAIRRSVGFMLKTSGFAVEAWPSGVAFLKEVRHATPGCILLDVQMPEMDGLEATREIRRWELALGRDRTPIIALTGYARPEDEAQRRDQSDRPVPPARDVHALVPRAVESHAG